MTAAGMAMENMIAEMIHAAAASQSLTLFAQRAAAMEAGISVLEHA